MGTHTTATWTIEVAGVAGSGKTTLVAALRERYPLCHVPETLHTRKPGHWPYVLHALPQVAPVLGRAAISGAPPSWDEAKYLLYASGWEWYLRRRTPCPAGPTIFDQGPIFALARLCWGSLPASCGGRFGRWLDAMVERWATALDVVVVLTAPDDVLIERIGTREQRHEAKGRAWAEALALLARHGRAYTRVIGSLEAFGHPRILRFDTESATPTAIVAELDDVMGRPPWAVTGNVGHLVGLAAEGRPE